MADTVIDTPAPLGPPLRDGVADTAGVADVPEPTLLDLLDRSRQASRFLATATTAQKDAALRAIATGIRAGAPRILPANALDLAGARDEGLPIGMQDRLRLDETRLAGLADAVLAIAALTDPVGEKVRGRTLPNGLDLTEVRVPFGVVGVIYEARPNVTVDIAAIGVKSGNAVVLRGGSAALNTNRALVEIVQEALTSVGVPAAAVQTIDRFGREGAQQLMRARGYVDVLVPRGSAGLIDAVVAGSTVPVIETGAGVVHVFLDESADVETAVDIVANAKVQRPSVCNAVETLLVHAAAAPRLLPAVMRELTASGVVLHADDAAIALRPDDVAEEAVVPATDEDWSTEYNSLDLSVAVVQDLDAALEHIRRHSTHHTESILTNDLRNAERFLAEVDSAVVMVNASTRFTDGGEFGFGAEVGISTQKLHARGPMGLTELTSTKWLVRGSGQVRR
jgi:glutamate-5-semialdehyde dehydrogenase